MKLEKLKELMGKLSLSGGIKKKLIWVLVALVMWNLIVVPIAASFGLILPVVALEEAFKYLLTIATLGSV